MMRVRLLNLEDAFRLASVLSKYVDVKQLNPEQNAIGFISDIANKIPPREYLACVAIITNKTEEDVVKRPSLEILSAFVRGLRINKIISLLDFYKLLGL